MSPKTLGVVFIVVGMILIVFHRRIGGFHRRTDEMVSGKALPGSSPLSVLVGGVASVMLGLFWLLR